MDEASLKKVHETVMEKLKSACRLDLRATMDTIIKNKGNRLHGRRTLIVREKSPNSSFRLGL